jgi:outer membrane protein assembly factor BamB
MRLGMPFAFALPLATLFLLPDVRAEKPLVPAEDPPPRRVPVRPVPGGTTTTATQLSDEEALKQAGLPADDAAPLIAYLKTRTLSDTDQSKIGDIIKKFGADDFEERVKATEEVERFGPAAIGPLKAAERDNDPEIAYRAKQALKRMEKVPHSAVAAAAVRTIVKLKPKEAVSVLVGFLPLADTEEVAEEIRTALTALAVTDGKPDPALVQALSDKSVVRRSAAYVALIEGGPPGERIRIKEAFPLVKEAVRKEPDIDAKFRGLWSMLLTTREKEFVPDLIDMIPKLPRGRIWQLEELLLQMAGDGKPNARFGKTDESLTKAKDLWAAWWKQKGGSIDLAKFEFTPRITGHTDIIEYDWRGYGQFRVLTLGPDLKEKAKVGGAGATQMSYPTDVKKLPNGNYLVSEMNTNRITERDSTGKIIKTTSISQPLAIDLIPDGGMVVVCRNQVVQYDKEMKQVWQHPRQQYDIMGGRRLPDGDVVYITQANQGNNCFRIGAKDGKDTGKSHTFGPFNRGGGYQSIDATGEDKILVCEANRVVEYDLKTGKDVWKHDVNAATSCQRLPNGNTLITVLNHNPAGKVMEVDPTGEVVWEYESKDGLRAARAYRR